MHMAPVSGTVATGYAMTLCPTHDSYWLDADTVVSSVPLSLTYHGFYLDKNSVPPDFWTWWDAKGVNAAASPLTWQGVMWQIINGNQPTFYLRVTDTVAVDPYMLVDGLQKLAGAGDQYLRVNDMATDVG